jgi:hypothetical protein
MREQPRIWRHPLAHALACVAVAVAIVLAEVLLI